MTQSIYADSSPRTLREGRAKARSTLIAARSTGGIAALCLLFAILLPRLGFAQPTVIDYQRDIQPLFDRYCVACHAWFDAPCQLDLTHSDGVSRGASKQPVYDGTRIEEAQLTRLFIDARSSADWRKKGFFSVTKGVDAPSLLLRVLDLKARHPLVPDEPLSDGIELGIGRDNQCMSSEESTQLAVDDAQLGMPFALPSMKAREIALIRAWVEQGARAETKPPSLTPSERSQIRQWEAWLNSEAHERALVARWLFEHWAIARLHFDGAASGNFFRLVRSVTLPGRPVEEIATRFPNSDPHRRFYYRLQQHLGKRVAKTHITFARDNDVLQRIEQLFFARDWRVRVLPGYSESERANPFTTFAAIPAEARYRECRLLRPHVYPWPCLPRAVGNRCDP